MEIIKTYKGYKPLCYIDEENVLVYKKLGLYSFNLKNEKFEYIASFTSSLTKKLGSNLRILERILRLEPRCAIKSDRGILISIKGFIYKLDLETYKLEEIHKFREGMSSVLSFCKISDIKAVDKGIYYGEYLSNDSKKEVSICKYDENLDEFKTVYTFGKGKINHIHQIIEDKYRNRVWIMTGDFGEAAAIWYTDDNFNTVKLFEGNNQKYRACKVFIVEEGLVYGTDTPLENNSIEFIKLVGSENVEKIKLADIDGSVIYGTESKNEFIISTTVEGEHYPNSSLRSLFTYRRGKGIKSWKVNLMAINKSDIKDTRKIKEFKKDIYPMALCQFGAIQFIENPYDNNICICYGNSIKKYDGSMIILR